MRLVEGIETIEVTLSSGLNLGAKSSTRIDIVEQNVAPTLSLSVTQNSEERNLVTQQGGDVSLVANVMDVNPSDEVTLQWRVNGGALTNQSADPLQFVFDPINVAPGIYQIDAIASDNGSPSLTSKKSSFIEVIESLPQLGDQDSDGDLIPDSQEGVKDSDGDGIPDYLDAIDDCNVIQQRVTDPNQFLAEALQAYVSEKAQTYLRTSQVAWNYLIPNLLKIKPRKTLVVFLTSLRTACQMRGMFMTSYCRSENRFR
ncbi:hypothetical protein [Pseudoalteromonas xiamenensis]|uniref:hypothetical protein n=1 Tax=Pseudoalteromonas xiamenensis TaxID=882626 RepID=UPI001FCC5D3D|nr:hypothetical protein [Pseudoalteromonas xiamenensis]